MTFRLFVKDKRDFKMENANSDLYVNVSGCVSIQALYRVTQ